MKKVLSEKTQNVVQNFLQLPFDNHNICCPYFNNKKSGSRGALRVLIGKGNPDEIVEEAQILALREKINLKTLSDNDLTKFLVEKNLGIDCSALAYYILDAESKKPLKKILQYPHAKNPLRKLLTKLRPVENTSVKTLAHEKNSTAVKLSDVQPGDMIILRKAGPRKDYNHVMIITNVDKVSSLKSEVRYVHAFQYPDDGLYDHGVHKEKVIFDPNKKLSEQDWKEKKMKQYIQTAEHVGIQRLKNI